MSNHLLESLPAKPFKPAKPANPAKKATFDNTKNSLPQRKVSVINPRGVKTRILAKNKDKKSKQGYGFIDYKATNTKPKSVLKNLRWQDKPDRQEKRNKDDKQEPNYGRTIQEMKTLKQLIKEIKY